MNIELNFDSTRDLLSIIKNKCKAEEEYDENEKDIFSCVYT